MTMITTTDGTEIYCKDATLVGHSTNGGAVYIRRHGTKRVVLVAAVPPIMLKSAANPEGLPMEHFDKLRSGINVRDGEWLGEMGVIEGRSRNATAPAAADGEVEVLTARQFSERVSSELALARDLICGSASDCGGSRTSYAAATAIWAKPHPRTRSSSWMARSGAELPYIPICGA